MGPPVAILIIAVFAGFVIWGRTAGGQAALIRVFGARKPTRPTRRSSGTQGARRTATRRVGSTASPKQASRRPASKRGASK